MRNVVVVFRTRPGQAVRVLVVGERVLVTRRHHDHGPGQVGLGLVEVIAAAVPRMTLQGVSLLLLVREEFRLEICKKYYCQTKIDKTTKTRVCTSPQKTRRGN